MSRENVDLVRSIYAAWERGDYDAVHWAHPDIEFVIADGPAPGRWTGLAGMADGFRDFLSAWEHFWVEAAEYRDLDDTRVLVLEHRRGQGKTSGLDLERMAATGAHLFHVRDGKVTRQVIYFDRERALADLAVSEQSMPEDNVGTHDD